MLLVFSVFFEIFTKGMYQNRQFGEKTREGGGGRERKIRKKNEINKMPQGSGRVLPVTLPIKSGSARMALAGAGLSNLRGSRLPHTRSLSTPALEKTSRR